MRSILGTSVADTHCSKRYLTRASKISRMWVRFGLARPCKYLSSSLHTSSLRKSHWTPEQTSAKMAAVNKVAHPFDKTRLEALLNRRFFYAPAFEIYGGK